MLDYILEEYLLAGRREIVCYSAGQFGGVRAAMQLRMTLGELDMPSIPTLLGIRAWGKRLTRPVGRCRTGSRPRWRTSSLTPPVGWYAGALKQGRAAGTPY